MDCFSKKDIVNLAKKENFFEEDFTDDTLENKLNNLIDFLNDLEMTNIDDNKLLRIMNLDESKPKRPYKPYKFNLPTYIFLCLLLNIYDNDYFYKVYIGKSCSYEKANSVMFILEEILPEYEALWENNKQYYLEKYNINWGEFSFLVLDKIFELITPEYKPKNVGEIDCELVKIISNFLSLPDNLKIRAYEKSRNRLKYIKENIISEIEKEIEIDPVYKVDKEMLEKELKNCYN